MNNEKKITEHNKKKKWVKPELKVLGFNKTFNGVTPTSPESISGLSPGSIVS